MLVVFSDTAVFKPPALGPQSKVITDSAEHYIALADMFKREELPYGTQWREVESYREKQVASNEYQWLNFREQKKRKERIAFPVEPCQNGLDQSKIVRKCFSLPASLQGKQWSERLIMTMGPTMSGANHQCHH
eukprot:1128216-Pelagomonas_calceolata.AAC.1